MRLIPNWNQFKNWTLPSKASYIGLILALLTLAASLPVFPSLPQLSVNLLQIENATIEFKNSGNDKFQITSIKPKLKYRCDLLLRTREEFLLNFLRGIPKLLRTEEFRIVSEIENIVLSPGEAVSRSLIQSKFIPEEIVCIFDMRLKIKHLPSSSYSKFMAQLLSTLRLVKDSTTLYFRYDGCSFRRIGKQNQRQFVSTSDNLSELRTGTCEATNVIAKNIGSNKALNDAINNDMKKLDERGLIAFVLMSQNQIIEQNAKGDGQKVVTACRLWAGIVEHLKEREASKIAKDMLKLIAYPTKSYNETLMFCLGLDTDLLAPYASGDALFE